MIRRFVRFGNVPDSVLEPAYERAKQLLTIQDMELENLSHKLFPNGNVGYP
jgi:hypothetical protein